MKIYAGLFFTCMIILGFWKSLEFFENLFKEEKKIAVTIKCYTGGKLSYASNSTIGANSEVIKTKFIESGTHRACYIYENCMLCEL